MRDLQMSFSHLNLSVSFFGLCIFPLFVDLGDCALFIHTNLLSIQSKEQFCTTVRSTQICSCKGVRLVLWLLM